MKVLFAIDSVFQLMIAVNMRLTIYKEYEVDAVIYNSTLNADSYAERLRETQCFGKVFLAETPLTYCGQGYTKKQKIPKYLIYIKSLINPEYVFKSICPDFCDNYDVFLFNGVGALPECIYNAIRKRNDSVKCYRFEDSYLSYTQEYGSIKGKFRIILENIASLWGRKRLEENVSGYYFSEPGLVNYEFKYPIFQSEKFSRTNDALKKTLNHVFALDKLNDDYHEKYLFFECGDAFFFNNNDDLRFIDKLVELVGKDNVLIKRHPRIKENRFENKGVHIASGSTVPWELIQLNIHMEDKVFITTKSAAAITSEVYFGDKCSAILLYKGINGEQGEISENFEKYMVDFKNKSNNGFWLPESIDEFISLIKIFEEGK